MVLFNIKILLALQSASLSIIYPFLNLHMSSLGFTRQQITQTNIIICFSDIIVPILAGVLADKVEHFRCYMMLVEGWRGRVNVITWQVSDTNTDNLQWSSQRVFISTWSPQYIPISHHQNSL